MTPLIFGSPDANAIVARDKEIARLIYILSGLIDARADPQTPSRKQYIVLFAKQVAADPELVAIALERIEQEATNE